NNLTTQTFVQFAQPFAFCQNIETKGYRLIFPIISFSASSESFACNLEELNLDTALMKFSWASRNSTAEMVPILYFSRVILRFCLAISALFSSKRAKDRFVW